MVLIIAILVFILLYFDNATSVVVGGGDRGTFHMVFVLFLLVVFVLGIIRGIKRRHYIIPKISIPLIIISLVLVSKYYFSTTEVEFQRMRYLYSLAWLLLVVSTENIFIGLDIKKNNLFLVLMSVLFFYSVYNAWGSFRHLSMERNIMLIPSIYLSVMFMPWLFMLRNKYKIYWIIALTVLLVITFISAKRGAIVCVTLGLFVYVLSYFRFNKKHFPLLKLIVILLVFVLLFKIVDSSLGGLLSARFSEEELIEGSGRNEIYREAIGAIMNMRTVKEVLFGYSFDSSALQAFGGHNDWLTFMITNGFVGLFAFAFLFIGLLKNRHKVPNLNKPAYNVLLIMMFLQSLYSTTFNPTIHPIFAMLFIGYIEAQIINDKTCLETNHES